MKCAGNGCLPKVMRLRDPLLVGAQCVSDQADENDKDKTAGRKTAAGRLLNSISSVPKQCLA